MIQDLRRLHLPVRNIGVRKYRIAYHSRKHVTAYRECYYLCQKFDATYPELKRAGVVVV